MHSILCLVILVWAHTVNGQCKAGFFLAAANQCDLCRDGTTSGDNAVECEPCVAGYYETDNACLPCPPGSHAPDPAAVTCRVCPPGLVALNAGAIQCATCPSSNAVASSGRTCTECPPFFFPDPSRVFCLTCPPGHVREGNQCATCLSGSYSKGFGAGQCTSCPPGTFAEKTGSDECLPCQVGTIAPVNGSTGCAKCGFYETTVGPGATECVDNNIFTQKLWRVPPVTLMIVVFVFAGICLTFGPFLLSLGVFRAFKVGASPPPPSGLPSQRSARDRRQTAAAPLTVTLASFDTAAPSHGRRAQTIESDEEEEEEVDGDEERTALKPVSNE